MTLRGIHFGSYWMGENDVVFLMARDLAALCEVSLIDIGLYCREESSWYLIDASRNPKRPIHWLDHERVMEVVAEVRADFVCVNSGGISLRPETSEKLRAAGVVTVGISLSDPDVYRDHGAAYAHLYDLYYTNSLYSLNHQYSRGKNVKWLPFAASPGLHRPMADVEKIYDVVVVGHARPDRLQVVHKLQKHFSVGLFGNGWGTGTRPVNGEDHVQAVNSGKMYLSFSATVAGYMNVKVGLLEAAACRLCLVSQSFGELERFFRPGVEIALYKSTDGLIEVIRYYLGASHVREWMAENSYRRLLAEHTWVHRWKEVLNDVRTGKLE
jgi:hypothetical protein